MPNLSRRDVLKLASNGLLGLSGLLGLGALFRFLSYQPAPPPPKRFEVGDQSLYLPNSRTVITAIPAVLIRIDQDFTAFSLVCTHLGCTVELKPGEFTCPCHGSRYDLHTGAVKQGPASKALQPLKVEVEASGLVVIFKG